MSGKIIQFRKVSPENSKHSKNNSKNNSKNTDQKSPPDSTAIKLLKISDELDAVILKHASAGDIDLRDLAGLLSHRLGTLVSHLEDKEELLPLCMNVLKKQAKVD